MELLKTERPENVIDAIDSIEIIAPEKEPLTDQLIEELTIGGLIKPENEYEMIEEFTLLRKEKPEMFLIK